MIEGRRAFSSQYAIPRTVKTYAKKRLRQSKEVDGRRMLARCSSLSRNTLDLWLKREEQTGDCQAITNYQQGCKHKITDWQRFNEFVRQHGGKTQAQMAKQWGDNVTQQNISDAMQKIGVSRKKKT